MGVLIASRGRRPVKADYLFTYCIVVCVLYSPVTSPTHSLCIFRESAKVLHFGWSRGRECFGVRIPRVFPTKCRGEEISLTLVPRVGPTWTNNDGGGPAVPTTRGVPTVHLGCGLKRGMGWATGGSPQQRAGPCLAACVTTRVGGLFSTPDGREHECTSHRYRQPSDGRPQASPGTCHGCT
jgi:hypothetical protein